MTEAAWLLAGGITALLGRRLFKRLARLTEQYPEDVYMFLQPLNWEDFERDRALEAGEFDHNYGSGWCGSGRFAEGRRRRNLRARIVLDREYLGRMDYNLALLELSNANDRRVCGRWRKDQARDSQRRLETAAGMEKEATALEREAEQPENQPVAQELKCCAARIRAESKKLLAEDAEYKTEFETHARIMAEARSAFREFRSPARWQLPKLDCLSLLLSLDRLMVLPVRPVVGLWQKGMPELLRLYQQAREKALAYGVLYRNDDEISKRM
ncbi:MAG TPA: hypothetical protein VNV88_16435 [Candidatus Solibacter sp.]|nr:hypothetical protein [Candidatus Solibacter sp.]